LAFLIRNVKKDFNIIKRLGLARKKAFREVFKLQNVPNAK